MIVKRLLILIIRNIPHSEIHHRNTQLEKEKFYVRLPKSDFSQKNSVNGHNKRNKQFKVHIRIGHYIFSDFSIDFILFLIECKMRVENKSFEKIIIAEFTLVLNFNERTKPTLIIINVQSFRFLSAHPFVHRNTRLLTLWILDCILPMCFSQKVWRLFSISIRI